MNDPTGGYTIAYDNMGRQIGTATQYAFLPGKTYTAINVYDAASNRTTLQAPDGSTNTYTYDTLNRLTQMASAKSGTTLATFTYTLFPAGNRQTAADLSGRSATYGYDNDYRLTSEAIAGDPGGVNGTVGYTLYDAANNRKTMTSTLSAIPGGTFTYDANDQLTTDAYDANGNTIASGGITRTYDFENHLTSYGAVVIQNDGDGNRVSETIGGVTTKYLVDTLNPTGYAQVMDEVVGTSVSRTYAYGLNRISENQLVGSTWTPSFYGYDGHGNVRFLTSSAGAVTDTYKYDAFGVQIGGTGSTPNSFLYSGEQYDSTLHLYYLRARYYNPAVGRFQSADPYEGRIQDPLTLNKYLYVGGNPTRFVDPAGLDAAENAVIRIELNEALRLGPDVTIKGYLEVSSGQGTAYVEFIQGVVRNPFSLLPQLQEAAISLGAESLDVVTQFANERLLNLAVTRYGFVTVGGYEIWSIKF